MSSYWWTALNGSWNVIEIDLLESKLYFLLYNLALFWAWNWKWIEDCPENWTLRFKQSSGKSRQEKNTKKSLSRNSSGNDFVTSEETKRFVPASHSNQPYFDAPSGAARRTPAMYASSSAKSFGRNGMGVVFRDADSSACVDRIGAEEIRMSGTQMSLNCDESTHLYGHDGSYIDETQAHSNWPGIAPRLAKYARK